MRTEFQGASARRGLPILLAVYPIAVALLAALTWLLAPRSGPLALLQIVIAHFAIVGLVMGVAAALLRSRLLAAAVITMAIVVAARVGGDWLSVPAAVAAPTGTPITVMTWNLQFNSRSPQSAVRSLLAQRADVVALQELTTDVSAAIDADPGLRAAYPYRLLMPDRSVFGLGLLSRHPLVEELRSDRNPVALAARVRLPSGEEVNVFNAHPMPGDIEGPRDWLPLSFDARERDRSLVEVRTMIDSLMAGSTPLVVLGDYNVSPTEPGYRQLTAGLTDVHAEIGNGPGWTWRPSRLVSWGIGLLRIDYVLTSAAVAPVGIGEDCTQAGDHCIVTARLELG